MQPLHCNHDVYINYKNAINKMQIHCSSHDVQLDRVNNSFLGKCYEQKPLHWFLTYIISEKKHMYTCILLNEAHE